MVMYSRPCAKTLRDPIADSGVPHCGSAPRDKETPKKPAAGLNLLCGFHLSEISPLSKGNQNAIKVNAK